MTRRRRLLAVLLLAVAATAVYAWLRSREPAPAIAAMPEAPVGVTVDTPHFRITSTAPREQAVAVGDAMEVLHRAFIDFFEGDVRQLPSKPRLAMRLYRDRDEFQANNRSRPWAEAYYLDGISHAYVGREARNRHHWMLHEATHQLTREVAVLKPPKWISEGLATYFGTSRIEGGKLLPGTVDGDTYPIWWLDELGLSNDLQADIRDGRIIPLRAIISGKDGPPIERKLNLYYIEYWSLSHFLLHHDGGRRAKAYRELMLGDGSLAAFEQAFGPVDAVEAEWYAYLQGIATDAPSAATR